MKKILSLAIILFLIPSYTLKPATLVRGNATAPNNTVNTFDQFVSAKTYNPATGDLFVGLGASGSGNFSISILNRQNVGSQNFAFPTFQAIAAGGAVQGTPIDFLTLINSIGNTFPLIAATPVSSPQKLDTQTAYAQTSDGKTSAISSILKGVNDVPTANGPDVFGISGIVGAITEKINKITQKRENYILAAVSPQQNGGFGNIGSGIAVVNAVYNTPPFPNAPTLQLNQVAAVPDQTGIKAVRLDPTIKPVDFLGTNTVVITLNRVSQFWDDQLQRLFVGLQLATNPDGIGAAGDGAASVVLGRLDENEQGELTLENFLPSNALINGQAINIVAAKQLANMPLHLSAAQLNVLHASTGPSYLIVWGGNGIITTNPNVDDGTVGNRIWALPLVDKQDTTDPDQGKLAAKNDPLVDHRFVEPVTINADLTTDFDEFAQVGAGPLPVQPYTPISGVGSGLSDPNGARDTLDIVVSGDTVFVAIASPQTDIDDAGVFYSQAMFDPDGKIIRWTPWAKRAFPFDAFFSIPENNGNVRYVSVDPVTGKIVAVDGSIGKTVKINSWDSFQFTSDLPKLVNQALCNGSYSVLDLDQSLSVLSEPGPSRYALFGGINKVVFARTTLSRNEDAPFNVTTDDVPAAQKLVDYFLKDGQALPQGCLAPNSTNVCNVPGFCNNCSCCNQPLIDNSITLFFDPENFRVTDLPAGAGAVKVLEYSKQPAGLATNYFFAGTNAGLFVFAQGNGLTATGFDASLLGHPDLGELDKAPFSTGSWQKIVNNPKDEQTIPGSIIDIKTSGLALYILTVEFPFHAPTVYRLFRVNFAETVGDMFNSGTIFQIAQTGTENLAQTKAFYSIQIINMTSDNGQPTTEQLILATNNGLFMSSDIGGVQNAISQTEADWQLVNGSDNSFFCGIGGMDTILPTTAWPFSLGPLNNPKIYNRSDITQVNGGTTEDNDGMTPLPFQFVPSNFNANALTDPGEPFATFAPITYFTSDGARRFFIIKNPCCTINNNVLQVSPYNVLVNTTNSPTIVSDSSLQFDATYFWAKQIGATGLFMAGINTGVAALE